MQDYRYHLTLRRSALERLTHAVSEIQNTALRTIFCQHTEGSVSETSMRDCLTVPTFVWSLSEE